MTGRKRSPHANSGSPSTGEPEYLLVGMLRHPHGVRGEILMQITTDFPERLKPGAEVFLGPEREPATITSCRHHDRGLILGFEGISSPEGAGQLRNQPVCVLASDRPALPQGMYYHHEMLGCMVIDEERGNIGSLAEILQTGANDVYVVKGTGDREILLPAIAGVVLMIDTKSRIIRVRIPAGLDDGPQT